MKYSLHLAGAADTVTGSRSLLTVGGRGILIDCGLFQGLKEIRDRNRQSFDSSSIDAIVLTHAHLDHSGYLPRLVREGYQGPIYCTPGTADLCRVLLRDAAHLEEETARYANESGYSHHRPAEPLFTREDAERALALLRPIPRHQWRALVDGVELRFLRAGHIIGASLAQLAIANGNGGETITFSGDLGNGRSFILKGPETGVETDVLVLESTYGDRLQPREDPLQAFADIANRTFARGGVMVIPAFAVGRAQEITYMIRLLQDQKRIPTVPVILDSPMASAATDICLSHGEDQILESAFLGDGDIFRPRRFEVATTPDQSMLACVREGPLAVITASGMLNGGRVLHHLKRRLPDAKNTVVFCGYQADGTKGRFLQDNAGSLAELRIHHVPVAVAAEIATIDHLSAHADRDDLLAWVGRMRRLPRLIVLNHGAPAAQRALAAALTERYGVATVAACDQSRLP